MGSVEFRLVEAPADLARDVECLRLARQRNDHPVEIRTCPNGTPGLVFHTVGGGKPGIAKIATRTSEGSGFPLLFLHGQGSQPSVMTFCSGNVITLQVALKPQAVATIFALPASDLAADLLGPDSIGAEDLLNQLLAASEDEERIEAVWAYLRLKQALAGPRDELVERSLELIQKNVGMTVQTLIQTLNLSERQFEKRFARTVGCPPLRYLRVKRINEALRLMATGRYERLTEIAYALNFYDQSHFIRDMKEFSWLTPTELSQQVSEFRLDQTGVSYQ
jgi:AraC-like DNA-binding protein